MNFIQPTFEIIEQSYDGDLMEGMMRHIEICGRNCYKSEDKITQDSYKGFIQMLERSDHGAMLEHGTVYMTIPLGSPTEDQEYFNKHDLISFFENNQYSKVNKRKVSAENEVLIENNSIKVKSEMMIFYITTNWRVIFENGKTEIIEDIDDYHFNKTDLQHAVEKYYTKPTEFHEKRYTVKFTCDIGVAREYNRHRHDSIAEESTRYCNYTKDKFQEGNGGLNICIPCWLSDNEKKVLYANEANFDFISMCGLIYKQINNDVFQPIDYWVFANLAAEFTYENLIKSGWTAQKARTVLPLDTKSTLIHTAFISDWKHFFDLRALGSTGAPHPSAKELALPLMNRFVELGFMNKSNEI